MVKGPKRQATGEVSHRVEADELKALTSIESEVVIPVAEDKLAALVMRVPPSGSLTGIEPSGSGGQFFVVLSGSMRLGDQVLRAWEHVFVSADESPFVARAGDAGLEVLFLQFPLKAPEYAEV
jgi:hypothetical protein